MSEAADLLNLFDYERLTAERLPQLAYDYFASGAHDELTLHANREAFERIALLPRVLVDVSERDSSVELLGRRHALPLVVAPMAFAKMADPAGEAAIARAAGVIVSNHGGRQLDTAVASIDALSAVAEAVAGRAAERVDGGVRRGTDIVKAIARGADAVLVGRPLLWGLAVDGEAGAAGVLRILREEFELAMALCGCKSVDAIDESLLA